MKGRNFRVDRKNGKLLGLCAGIANATGIDATFVRVAVVLAVVLGSPWFIAAYFAAALYLRHRETRGMAAGSDAAMIREWREGRSATLNRRIDAIEHEAMSRESRLARDIEALR